jgi:hypothetical protein
VARESRISSAVCCRRSWSTQTAELLVPLGDPLADIGLELGDAAVRGAAQLPVGELGEPGAAHSDDRGSQVTTVISFRVSVVRSEPRRTPDGAKSSPLRPTPLPGPDAEQDVLLRHATSVNVPPQLSSLDRMNTLAPRARQLARETPPAIPPPPLGTRPRRRRPGTQPGTCPSR